MKAETRSTNLALYREGRRYIAALRAGCAVAERRLTIEPNRRTVDDLRHAYLASLGARIRLDRETKQVLAVRIVERLSVAGELDHARCCRELSTMLNEPAFAAIPDDYHSQRAIARRAARGLVAWLMVRNGVLVAHRPTEPDDRDFPSLVEKAKDKLRKAERKLAQ